MTKSFVEYIKQQPMVFEVFGHYQPPALHRVAIQDVSNQQLQQVCLIKIEIGTILDSSIFPFFRKTASKTQTVKPHNKQ